MRKIQLIVHECFAGKQNPKDVFAAVFLSSAAVLTESRYHGIMIGKIAFAAFRVSGTLQALR